MKVGPSLSLMHNPQEEEVIMRNEDGPLSFPGSQSLRGRSDRNEDGPLSFPGAQSSRGISDNEE